MFHRTFSFCWLKPGLFAAALSSAGAADFEIWTGPDGTLLLQGTMDRASRDAVVAAAQRGLGAERRMVEYIRVDDSSGTQRWTVSLARVLSEVLQVKGDLNLEVTEDGKISIQGTLEDATDRERIEQSLLTAFPKDSVSVGRLVSRLELDREKELQAKLQEKTGGKTGPEAMAHLLKETVIHFDSASVALADAEKEKLDLLAAVLVRNEADLTGSTIVIQGFTDGKGSEDTNRWYRETRCQAVRDYLIGAGAPSNALAIAEKEGVPSRPTVVAEESGEGSGEDPVEGGEAENPRRVEFRRENLAVVSETAGGGANEGDPATGSEEELQPEVVVEERPDDELKVEEVADADAEATEGTAGAGEGGGAADPGAGEEPAVEEPQTQGGVERLLADSIIEFGSGSTWLSREGRLRLEKVAEAMRTEKGAEGAWKLEIVGSSDAKGDPEVNAWLRKNRCKSVVNQLVALGVDPERIVVVSGDQEAPRARVVGAENDAARDAAARRVTLRVGR